MQFTEILGLRHVHQEGRELRKSRTKHVLKLHQQQGELGLKVCWPRYFY
jgi:catechol 2,3-dioxygenase-like lactoylglutathione lyase family enzyme